MTNPIIEYWPNGNRRIEQYKVNGQLHRDPSIRPAFISYYRDGQKHFEEYYLNHQFHRDQSLGPAFIIYHENEHVIRKEYWFNGELHNPYGPAYFFNSTNVIEWWLNDKEYTNKVNEYLNINNLKYNNMTHTDFDIMWITIL